MSDNDTGDNSPNIIVVKPSPLKNLLNNVSNFDSIFKSNISDSVKTSKQNLNTESN
jgi:hypothetical protein